MVHFSGPQLWILPISAKNSHVSHFICGNSELVTNQRFLTSSICYGFYITKCMYVRTYVCVYVCMYVCMHVHMYVCMYVCMHVHMYVCMYVYMYVHRYVCMYIRMYVYISMYGI